MFFVLGFLTWVSGILIPYFQLCLQLSLLEASLVSFSIYVAYFLFSLPSARILSYTGYKNGISIGLLMMALGTGLFIPAAYVRTFSWFLIGLFITGCGTTLLQTAVNPYIAILGPPEGTAQRIGFMGLSNKLAGILSVSVLGAVFLFDADVVADQVNKAGSSVSAALLHTYLLKVVQPYSVITGILILLSVLVYVSRLPEVEADEVLPETGEVGPLTKSSVFDYPHLCLGIVSLFVSTACEGLPIDGIIVYGKTLGVSIEEGRIYIQYSLYAMLLGYVASVILIPKYLSQQKGLVVCSIIGLVLTILTVATKGRWSVYCFSFSAFAGAMLWGLIFGLALKGLGKFTNVGAALLLMAVVGGGLFPLLFAKILESFPASPQVAIAILIPCYLFLWLYAVWGCKLKNW